MTDIEWIRTNVVSCSSLTTNNLAALFTVWRYVWINIQQTREIYTAKVYVLFIKDPKEKLNKTNRSYCKLCVKSVTLILTY
jgi:predicted metallo-beta-lactamase superfamily hydrolase